MGEIGDISTSLLRALETRNTHTKEGETMGGTNISEVPQTPNIGIHLKGIFDIFQNHPQVQVFRQATNFRFLTPYRCLKI